MKNINAYEKYIELCREIVRNELNKMPKANIDLFNRMYGGIEEIKEEQMKHAYSQIMNTKAGKK